MRASRRILSKGKAKLIINPEQIALDEIEEDGKLPSDH
jgi:hypothetical protein